MKKEPIKMVCLPAEDSIINTDIAMDKIQCFIKAQDFNWMYMSPLGRLFEKYKEEVKNGKK